MTSFPVSLDNLIAFVKAQQPDDDPLGQLSAAVSVGARIDEQADSLIGHFVDQARRAGASWSQIGASMGVTKQAVQKRFVPRRDGSDVLTEGQLFSRFTQRARNSLAAARTLAGDDDVAAAHIVVGLLSQPAGLAAKILLAGRSAADVAAALGPRFAPAPPSTDAVDGAEADPAALREIAFSADGWAVLKGTLKAVLRLGHNYVGTEHLLLGALHADGPAAQALNRLGLTVESVERDIEVEVVRIRAALRESGPA